MDHLTEAWSVKEINGLSAKKRTEVHNWLKAEVEAGRVKWPKKCEACRQDKGIIDAHHEDYDKPWSSSACATPAI